MDARLPHGPEGRDGRVFAIARLVPLLQDAGDRTADPCRRAQGTGTWTGAHHVRLARDPGGFRAPSRHHVSAAVGRGSQTIKAYGILNTTVAPDTSNYGIPFPGTFLLDRSGKVTSRFFEEAYQERNTVSTIMIATGNAVTPTTAQRRIRTDSTSRRMSATRWWRQDRSSRWCSTSRHAPACTSTRRAQRLQGDRLHAHAECPDHDTTAAVSVIRKLTTSSRSTSASRFFRSRFDWSRTCPSARRLRRGLRSTGSIT